jgi:hypothetical protein
VTFLFPLFSLLPFVHYSLCLSFALPTHFSISMKNNHHL